MLGRLQAILPKSRRGRIAVLALVLVLVAAACGWKWAFVSWKIRSARQALVAGEFEYALRELESAENHQPERAELLYLLARANRRTDRLDRFADYIARAESAGWSEEEITNQRYLALVQVGRFDRAQPFLNRMVEVDADDELAEEFYEAKAKGCLRTYRLVDARVCLNYWLQWKPKTIRARMWLADIHRRVNDWKAAVDEYQTVLEIDPRNAEAHRWLAECLLQLQDADGALKHFQQALEERPDNLAARIGVAKCERRLAIAGNPATRFQELLEADLSDPQRLEVLVELAQIEFRDASRPQVAVELLKQAEKIAPHQESVHATLSAAYRRLGNEKLAERHERLAKESHARLDRLVELTRQIIHSPKNADLRYEVGKIYLEQGMTEAGIGWLRTALQLNPRHEKARTALAKHESEFRNGPASGSSE